MWTINIAIVAILNFHLAYGETCVCAKVTATMYSEGESSLMIEKIHKDECFPVDTTKANGKWIGILRDGKIAFVSVDDVEFSVCKKLRNQTDRGQWKRFLDHHDCNKDRCPIGCICDHYWDLQYIGEHHECFLCIGCHKQDMDCDTYYAQQGYHGNHANQQSTSQVYKMTTTPDTTTNPTTTALTNGGQVEHVCDKLGIIHLLAEKTFDKNRTCDTGSLMFVTQQCNATEDVSKWSLGRKIIANCEAISLYTAVSNTMGSIFGSFVGCFRKDNGDKEIRIATQFCGKAAEIIHIPHDPSVGSVENYYTIAW